MIDLKIGGFQSIKKKLKQLIPIANRVENIRVDRSGTVDAAIYSGDSITIKLQDFPAQSTSSPGAGGGGGLLGVEIVWADQSTSYISATDMFSGYNPNTDSYWSMAIGVDALGYFDRSNIIYDSLEPIFEDNGAVPPVQIKYRLRLITQGVDSEGDPINASNSLFGQYREMTYCVNGAPFQILVKTT